MHPAAGFPLPLGHFDLDLAGGLDHRQCLGQRKRPGFDQRVKNAFRQQQGGLPMGIWFKLRRSLLAFWWKIIHVVRPIEKSGLDAITHSGLARLNMSAASGIIMAPLPKPGATYVNLAAA